MLTETAFSLITLKPTLGLLAILLTFVAFIPYIRSIRASRTKPHIFSWIIWGVSTVIVCFAQLAGNAGAGAWSTGVSGVMTLYIAWLAYKHRSDASITHIDWLCLITAFAAIPLWIATHNPLWAVIILTCMDTLGFIPTIRKAYHRPHEEQLLMYVLTTLRNLIAILALEHYSFTTLLFPAVIGLTCLLFVGMVILQRHRT